jgi:hypothetical protein
MHLLTVPWLLCAVCALHIPAVFDVTRRETLDSLANKWMDDFRQYSTHPEAVQMVVGNKIDLVGGDLAANMCFSLPQTVHCCII